MSDYDIHSCGYYCDRHACILRQRDELRDKLFSEQAVKTYSGGKPNYTQPIEREPMIDGWPLWSGLPPQEKQGLTATPLPAIQLQKQSEWHELTDGEIAAIKSKYGFGVNIFSFSSAVRELETWLKERNT
jgi:hypothetical protein